MSIDESEIESTETTIKAIKPLREEKNFKEADELREVLRAKGVKLLYKRDNTILWLANVRTHPIPGRIIIENRIGMV